MINLLQKKITMWRNTLLGLFFLLIQVPVMEAQEFLGWEILADVSFDSQYSETWGIDILTANFGEIVSSLEGNEVVLSGYMIPLDAMGTSYVLSRNPNASCFFCGGAGPETVVSLQIQAQHLKRYRTDAYLTFKGILELNESNERQMNYVLREAEPY